jgi:hypothetical protein
MQLITLNSFIEQPQAFNAQQSVKLQFLSFNNHKLALNAINHLPIPALDKHKLSMHSNQLSLVLQMNICNHWQLFV